MYQLTSEHDAAGDLDNEAWNSITMGTHNNSGIWGSDSLNIGNQGPLSTTHIPGIDPSLENSDVLEKYGEFSADADQTGAGGKDIQSGFLAQDTDELLNPIDRWTTRPFSMSDTVREETPRGRSESTSHSNCSGPHQVPAVLKCEKCEADPSCEKKPEYTGNSRKTSLAKHMRNKHSDRQMYQCVRVKNGSICNTVITNPGNRRRHLEVTHHVTFPPKDIAKRNPNFETDKILNDCFAKLH